jgi:hypothetical protein
MKLACVGSSVIGIYDPERRYTFDVYIIDVDDKIGEQLLARELSPTAYRPFSHLVMLKIREINMLAGRCRTSYITNIPGQETTYLEKRLEAQQYTADANPSPADYPILSAEARETEEDIRDLALEVLNLAAQWRAVGAQIEGIRRGAIKRAENARNEAQLNAIQPQFPFKPK